MAFFRKKFVHGKGDKKESSWRIAGYQELVCAWVMGWIHGVTLVRLVPIINRMLNIRQSLADFLLPAMVGNLH